jgi:hypothetical protein
MAGGAGDGAAGGDLAGAVKFAEVECRAAGSLCQTQGGGRGGWPTIKTYTAATGTTGAFYKQKASGPVCDELKVPSNMKAYVLDAVAATRAAAAGGAGTPEL